MQLSSKLMVIGSTGMLGKAVLAEAKQRGMRVAGFNRIQCDVRSLESVAEAINGFNPDVVINCAGIVPDRMDSEIDMAVVNGIGPRYIAIICKTLRVPFVQVSTDCVFSGKPYHHFPAFRYQVGDITDPTDLYGRSKLLGEVVDGNTTVVRTSFVGQDHGFLAWLIANKGKTIEGWTNALWSGSLVQEVAKGLLDLDTDHKGIIHLATLDKISKFNLAVHFNKVYSLGITIIPDSMVNIDRSLEPTYTIRSVMELVHA